MGEMIRKPFTVAALAEHWQTSETFVYSQISADRLKAFKLGGKLLRIKPEAVEEYECQASLTDSESSPAPEPMDQPIGIGASNGMTPMDRTAARLGRLIDRPQRPRLVTSGPVGR